MEGMSQDALHALSRALTEMLNALRIELGTSFTLATSVNESWSAPGNTDPLYEAELGPVLFALTPDAQDENFILHVAVGDFGGPGDLKPLIDFPVNRATCSLSREHYLELASRVRPVLPPHTLSDE